MAKINQDNLSLFPGDARWAKFEEIGRRIDEVISRILDKLPPEERDKFYKEDERSYREQVERLREERRNMLRRCRYRLRKIREKKQEV